MSEVFLLHLVSLTATAPCSVLQARGLMTVKERACLECTWGCQKIVGGLRQSTCLPELVPLTASMLCSVLQAWGVNGSLGIQEEESFRECTWGSGKAVGGRRWLSCLSFTFKILNYY